MQPFTLADDIARQYGEYVRTTFPLADPKLAEQLREKIEREHLLGTGLIVALQRPFMPGPSAANLVATGELHPVIAQIFNGWKTFHAHQGVAHRRLSERGGRRSTLVATGTGSGKTEAFLLPILDYCARHPGPGVKAVLVYPMNALANDQLERLRAYLRGTGITFGRYTGDTPQTAGSDPPDIPAEECYSRDAIRARRPNILITGYRMLEYLLVRRQDQAIFRPDGAGSQLAYLVLDEVHTYAGALGAEVACLIRRLRGHVEKYGNELTCVGASATVGEDQRAATIEFASKLFAVPFDSDSIVSEQYAPYTVPSGTLERIDVSQGEIDATAEIDELPAMQAQALYDELDSHPTIAWLRENLIEPRSLDALAEDLTIALGGVPSDVGALDAAKRQIAYFLLRGTLARDEDGALLRPRLHVFHRGIDGATRCLRCLQLIEGGATECPHCGGRALPLEICRQCGQDYLRTRKSGESPEDVALGEGGDFAAARETREQLRETSGVVVRLVRQLAKAAVAAAASDDDSDDEGDDAVAVPDARTALVCTNSECGYVQFVEGLAPCAKCGDENTVQLQAVSAGPMRACIACRSKYGAHEPVTTLTTGTAIGISILTWLTLAHLPEDQRRLLIFADSRQDTAYQAGYMRDVTSEYSWRQIAYHAIADRKDDPPDFDRFWNKLHDVGRTKYRIFTSTNAQGQKDDLHWFLIQEFSREAERRQSLEALGMVTVEYRYLEEIVERPEFALLREAAGARLSDDALVALLASMLDIVRRKGALNDEFARRFMDDERIRGVDRFNRRPVGFRAIGAGPVKSSYVTTRPFLALSGRKTVFEDIFARVHVADVPRAIKAAVRVLETGEYLVQDTLGGSLQQQQVSHLYVVNTGMMALRTGAPIWRCTNCGTLNIRNVSGRCIRSTCPPAETLALRDPGDDAGNFYVRMYRDGTPAAMLVAEHSGQISNARRETIEGQFKEGKLNVLVASPTLELGVDIGALTTVLLRGLPPSPANYAQRAGRAGRRERIALVASYAQSLPHDAYFYAHPSEIIAGVIPAPQFELDNAIIVKRHIRALALEKLEGGLPMFMGDFLNIGDDPSPADYRTSALRGDLAFVAELRVRREQIVAAVEAAFRDERSFDVLSAESIRATIDAFEHDLGAVLRVWHDEVKDVAAEIERINAKAQPTGEENRLRHQLQRTLHNMTKPDFSEGKGAGRSDAYSLGYLSNHGFLPSYAFPGEQAALFSRDLDDGEVQRDPVLALTEFAPGALVYVDGKKIRSFGVNLTRSIGGSAEEFPATAEAKFYRCGACGYISDTAFLGNCPVCDTSIAPMEEQRLEIAAFRGRKDEQITAREQQRSRTRFDVEYSLFGGAVSETTYAFDAARARYRRNQPLIAINRGLRRPEGATRFMLCLTCGEANVYEAQQKGFADWKQRHIKAQGHPPKEFLTALSHEFSSDVLLVEVPSYGSDEALTLRHAMLAAIRIEFQAEDGELDGFELEANAHRPTTVALFETVNGGAGYLQRAARDLPRIARRALQVLRHEPPCVRACYGCLLNYYNQRDHDDIDKRLVETLLTELAVAPPSGGTMAGADGASHHGEHESPIETRLEAIMRGKVPSYVTQAEVFDDDGKLVSRPDFLFEPQRLAIYADGRDFHSQPEAIEHDNRVRRRMRELGYRVLAFSGHRIAGDPAGCLREIVQALQEGL